jgi:ech hydrogenase subunit A
MAIIVVALFAAFVIQIGRRRKAPQSTIYLSGIGIDGSPDRSFKNSMGGVSQASQRNWYMESIFGEKVLEKRSNILGALILVAFFVLALIVQAGVL